MAKRRGNREGSVWRERKGWRAAVSLDGKRVTRSFRTKEECRVWLQEMRSKIDQGLTYKAVRLTLERYLMDWLSVHRLGLTPKTGERYEQLTRDYIIPELGKYRLQDLRIEQVERAYLDLLEAGVSVRNVRFVHAVLHRCLNDATKRGITTFNAAHGARLPKKKHIEMNILDEDQVLHLLIAAQGDRHDALYHLAIKTGMRQGELLGLKWADLDWKKGIIRVRRQVQRVKGQGMVFMPPKTKSGYRAIQLGEQALQKLREHRSKQEIKKALAADRWQDEDLIFPSSIGTPQSPSNLLKEFKVLLEVSGLPKIRFHDLRHTAASLMLNNGIPALVVSKVLGHSKPSTTLDIYGHLIPIMQEEVANLMDDLVTPILVEMGEKAESFPLE